MYFKKFFSGQIENNTTRKSLTDDAGTARSDYINQGTVVRNAVVETLIASGFDAFVEDETCVINVNGFRFSVYYANTMTMNIYSAGRNIHSSGSNNYSYQPFSSLEYKFYVTVKGNPNTSFNIYISQYGANISSDGYGIGISYVTTIIKKQRRVVVRETANAGTEANSVGYVRGIDGSLTDGFSYSDTVSFKIPFSQNPREWNDSGNSISLIPMFDLSGYCVFDGVYLRNTFSMTVGSFYNLNNKLYYAMNYNMLVEI